MTRVEQEILVSYLEKDITTYSSESIKQSRIGVNTRKQIWKLWLLVNYINYIIQYNIEDTTVNVLTDTQVNNIIEHSLYILNKSYPYRF